jgi:hypothetical protein
MNLARHASVLWRFRRVTAGGVVIGLILAFLAYYDVGAGKPRGTETWSAVSQILVTQPGSPEFRVTLPEQQLGVAPTTEAGQTTEDAGKTDDQVQFADPGRLAALADLYSKFLTSDEVLRRVPEHPPVAAINASPFASSQGGQILPVIQLTTMAPTAKLARDVNVNTYKSLVELIDERAKQDKFERVRLQLLVAPAVSLTDKPKPTMSVLVFMLVMLGTVAVAHLLEALRNRRQAQSLDAIVDWDAPGSGLVDVSDPHREPAVVASGGAGDHRRQRT